MQRLPIQVTGNFLYDSRIFLTHRIRLGKVGSDVLEPMILSDGSGAVLINRGWIPETIEAGLSLKADQLDELTLTGKIHVPKGKSLTVLSENLKVRGPKVRTTNASNLVEGSRIDLVFKCFPILCVLTPIKLGRLKQTGQSCKFAQAATLAMHCSGLLWRLLL